ncbi:hypothetical protein M3Y96_01136500 [Aphelenchoides besseyi]|nr:hypothetical protein M3Y96_01136500 [Aphelenchoides besseyi]
MTAEIADNLQSTTISNDDQVLIEELRSQLKEELKLVPDYDERTLLRWLIGWNHSVVPRLRTALSTISALNLTKQDFSSIEKITAYCDQITAEPTHYLPGSLLGYDLDGNIVSLQCLGKLDGPGLMSSVKISDLFVSRIAESYAVQMLLNEKERQTGRQCGTVLIIDLDGLSRDNISLKSVKVITAMLAQLQEMFPDVVRKIFIINAPIFLSTIWVLINPVLATETQKKITFLGSDWKTKLKESIDENILYEHWGGTRPSETSFGNVRLGGQIPTELYYSKETDPSDISELKEINVRARNQAFIDVDVKGGKLKWWWKSSSGDLDFWVIRLKDERLIWPKFRLLTEFVPEVRTISISEPGVYRLYFDNSHGLFFSKKVGYKLWTGSEAQ